MCHLILESCFGVGVFKASHDIIFFAVFLCLLVSPYFKTKLRGLYKTAGSDAETEAE